MNVLIFRSNSLDSFAAMLAALTSFYANDRYSVVTISAQYGDPFPLVEKEDDVFILDFSYPREVLLEVVERVNSLTLIDHSETVMKNLQGLDFAKVSLEKSGSVLSWEYFNPTRPVPLLLQCIQAFDLSLKFEGAIELCDYLQTLHYSLIEWTTLLNEPIQLKKCVEYGSYILRYRQAIAKQLIDSSLSFIDFGGFKRVPILNCDKYLSRELANVLFRLQTRYYPFLVTYVDDRAFRNFRLESSPFSEVNVATIAEQYGGGGHKHRSGFRIGLDSKNSILG